MKYTTGTFRVNYLNLDGRVERIDTTLWGDRVDQVWEYDQQRCRVLDCGVEGYVDLEFLDGSRLEVVSRGHVFF